MWTVLDAIKNDTELMKELHKKFPRWKPDFRERKDNFDLKPETVEELAKEMSKRPSHPKGEGYR